MWLLLQQMLSRRIRLAAVLFAAAGLFFYLYAQDAHLMMFFVPHLALGAVSAVVFGSQVVDERERRNALVAVLPLSRKQAVLARILWPFVLQTAFLPVALVMLAVFQWNQRFTAGLYSLLATHALLILLTQLVLVWEEIKTYLQSHPLGRVFYWLGPMFIGAFFGFTLSRELKVGVDGVATIVIFYAGALFIAACTYLLFLRRDEYLT